MVTVHVIMLMVCQVGKDMFWQVKRGDIEICIKQLLPTI